MPQADRIDVDAILSKLKDFQRRSVDFVFNRMYGVDPTRRFLLADEVGLGKTLVARGLIAKAIEHLRKQSEDRIDVVYICSNADIARQNISRLNVTGQPDFQLATRITLLPQTVRDLQANSLNFISFTPSTSFNLGHSTGRGEERGLLYWLLKWTWPDLSEGTAAMNVMQVDMTKDNFRRLINDCDPYESIDKTLAKQFKACLIAADKKQTDGLTYRERFRDLCLRFGRNKENIPEEDREVRNAFIGEMRALLAATCIEALEPDLIILDEFQRFKDLLKPDNPAGSLARHLFTWGRARVLLVSATPYKMYTLSQESAIDDHYKDFVDTLKFLIDDDAKTEHVKRLLAEYGRACARVVPNGIEPVRKIKREVEAELRRVMCRTEKLSVTKDRSGMLREMQVQSKMSSNHVRRYQEIRQVAQALGHPDVLEYWKASPYLLNFMDAEQYKFKELLRAAADSGGSVPVEQVLANSPASVLDASSWSAYNKIDPCHTVLEGLAEQTVGAGWWRLLWVPPSFPYYELSGVFADSDNLSVTKRLVFSSWNVVPRAISVLLSYEAERCMMKTLDDGATNTTAARERRRPLLVFARSDGRLTGMPVLTLLYPSVTLAKIGDPHRLARAGRQQPTLQEILSSVASVLKTALASLLARAPKSGPEDEAWYWATPILLDRLNDRKLTEEWFARPSELAQAWSGETDEAKGWLEHVEQAAEVALGQFAPKGRPPADLMDVLALLAIAGPGNCALRSLGHTLASGAILYSDANIRHAAGRMAWGIRSLFNTLEVIALIRGMNGEEPYWRRVLEYSAGGCFQSVIDEYLHILVELEGLGDGKPDEVAMHLAECVSATAAQHAQTPGVDWIRVGEPGVLAIDNQRVRSRFAMRFGDESGDQVKGGIRKDAVRAAFNSPFWPFVLATTSIGQEGLDFHPYCHAVMHWNLPSNPVDMEQREGRVHRYKGHAVRKNVAKLAQRSELEMASGENPWHGMFLHATEHGDRKSDISPYWVFPIEGGAVIERHAPTLPLSREAGRLPALRKSLAVYRMVFGQPRQDDLVEHLNRTVPESELSALSSEMCIDLEPGPDSGGSNAT
jgi:hypothetical protein